MSIIPLSTLIPDQNDFLAMSLEDVAGVLMVHLNSYPDGGNSVAQLGRISQENFFEDSFDRFPYPDQIRRVLLEAWSWLESEGLLAREIRTLGFFITRRGRSINSRADFDSYRKGGLLPKHQIHSLIAEKVYSAFLRGDYDVAVFLAFREVEIAVRQAGGFLQELVGEKLMRAAFAVPEGRLTDTQLPAGEQLAMAHLFAGAFGVYRNSTGHRYVPTQPEQAAEVIMFASQLLRIVDRAIPATTGIKQ